MDHVCQHNGGNYTITNADLKNSTDFMPKYLATMPYFSFANQVSGIEYYFRFLDMSVGWYQTTANVIGLGGFSKKVCEQLNLMSKGTANASLISWPGSITDLTPYACIEYPYGGGHPSDYYLLYRVF